MAPELPEEGWYRDPVDATRRRWWDGENWSTILTEPVAEPTRSVVMNPAMAEPATAAPRTPTMDDGTILPYATDARAGSADQAPAEKTSRWAKKPKAEKAPEAKAEKKPKAEKAPKVKAEKKPKAEKPPKAEKNADDSDESPRVRVALLAAALLAILATAAIAYLGKDDGAPVADAPLDVPITVPSTVPTTAPEGTTTTAPPADEPDDDAEPTATPVAAPSYRDAYDACQVILDGSSIGSGGMDYQTFRDIDADTVGPVTELRFEATDGDGATEAYLCRTLIDGDGGVMVGRLYFDLQNVLAG